MIDADAPCERSEEVEVEFRKGEIPFRIGSVDEDGAGVEAEFEYYSDDLLSDWSSKLDEFVYS